MGKYSLEENRFPSSLDEIGLNLDLQRLPGESMDDYRRRLQLQAKRNPTPKLSSIIETPQRKVGLFDKRILEIDLVYDVDGRRIAEDS